MVHRLLILETVPTEMELKLHIEQLQISGDLKNQRVMDTFIFLPIGMTVD